MALAGGALLALVACAPVKPPLKEPAPGHGSKTFSCTEGAQEWTVPDGVTEITIDAFGAQGGQAQDGTAGGEGGEATATIPVTPGEVLQVNVGCQPATGNPAAGGFNGGGASGTASGAIGNGGGGGGGASDVRQSGSGLADRVVIAGGGGGGGGSSAPCTGGNGGGTTGDAGSPCQVGPFSLQGGGGTQSAGGGGGDGGGAPFDGSAGTAGAGGKGGDISSSPAHSGGGGGGGLFGGGGGAACIPADCAGGGGGGSGLTPSGTGMTNGVRSGNGLVTITYEPQAVPDPPTNVTAALGSVIVSWTPPAYTGTSAITGYIVTEQPSGVTYTAGASATSLTIACPTAGTNTYTAQALNASGASAPSAPSNAVTVTTSCAPGATPSPPAAAVTAAPTFTG